MHTMSNAHTCKNSVSIFAAVCLAVLLGAGNSLAKLVPAEEIDLSSKSSPDASINASGGSFVSNGWKSTSGNNRLIVDLKKKVPKNGWGAVEVHVSNFHLEDNTQGACHFLSLLSGKSFIHFRGKRKADGGYACRTGGRQSMSIKLLFSHGGEKYESWPGAKGCSIWDRSTTYRFMIEVKGGNEFNVYINGKRFYGSKRYTRASDGMKISLAHDGKGSAKYGSWPGPVYEKVVVYRDDGKPEGVDPGFLKDHIRINCGGWEHEVDGWISDHDYQVHGFDYQWLQALSNDGVANAAPINVYHTLRHQELDFANQNTVIYPGVEMQFPVPDGNWTARMHFIDILLPFQRSITVKLNGNTVIQNMDIRTEAGRHLLALVKEAPVTVSGGKGLNVKLMDEQNNPPGDAFMCGLELIKQGTTPTGVDNAALSTPGSVGHEFARRAGPGLVRVTPPAAGRYLFRMIDASGQCRISRTVDGPALIRSPLEPGWYLLQMKGGGGETRTDVIIQK